MLLFKLVIRAVGFRTNASTPLKCHRCYSNSEFADFFAYHANSDAKKFNTLTGDKNWAKNRIWAAINQISDSNQAVAGEEGGTHYYFQIKKRKKEGNGVGKKIPFSRGTLYGKWVQWRVWYIASISEQNFSPIFFSLSSSQTHTHTHPHTHVHTHTHMHTCTHSHSHWHKPAYTHAHSLILFAIYSSEEGQT